MTETQTAEIVDVLKILPPEKVDEVRDFALFLSERFGNTPTKNNEASLQKPNPADLLAETAALPIEGKTNQFSGREHDKILLSQ